MFLSVTYPADHFPYPAEFSALWSGASDRNRETEKLIGSLGTVSGEHELTTCHPVLHALELRADHEELISARE